MLYAGTCSCQFEWGSSQTAASRNFSALSAPSVVIVAPPVEPVTLELAKLWRARSNDAEDALLNALIITAREYVQNYCGISLVTQTRQVSVSVYTEGMPLPYGPVQAVVAPEETEAPFTVTYVAGFPPVDPDADPVDYVGNIPESLKTAMQLLIGSWDFNREATVTGPTNSLIELGVRALLDPYRRRLGMAV